MLKFFFKLQSILNLKLQMEDNVKNELGKALNILEKEKNLLHRFKVEKDQCVEAISKKSGKLISIKTLRDYNVYISHLGNVILLQKEKVNLAENNVDKIREELLAIVKEREMLERLKEKKLEEYKVLQLKKEQSINDEIISFKHSKTFMEDIGDKNA